MKRWSGPVSQYQSEAELGEIAESLLAFPKRIFGSLGLGDIHQRPNKSQYADPISKCVGDNMDIFD